MATGPTAESIHGSARSRRPKLSLQTKPVQGTGIRIRNTIANANPKSPTAFNTLSNVYVTAIERSATSQATPLTAVRLRQDRTPTHYTPVLPHISTTTASPALQVDIVYPSAVAATPTLSAGPVDPALSAFSFAPLETSRSMVPSSPATQFRQVHRVSFSSKNRAPYSQNRSLHSILRNSPLLPSSARSPISSRRQSGRLREQGTRRVGYESPLTQTITTEKYTKSHIDLLVEEASPYTPSPAVEDSDMVLDLAMSYTGDETRDGGQTPGPFEEMRRRMTDLATATPVRSPRPEGIRRRKQKGKKRKWVWTIGKDDEDIREYTPTDTGDVSTPRTATTTGQLPISDQDRAELRANLEVVMVQLGPSSESDLTPGTDGDGSDLDPSETSSLHSSRATTPHSVDIEMKSPIADVTPGGSASTEGSPAKRLRLALPDLA
ncbi:hypothetical protein GGS20DRAFT_86385 [Poronia punctata]|nr:hypothetical protein GGS20DRAFT_86385 [Poronia punctata]